ncbi:MAG: geranylgeranylglyceryl/heptaprenylglyceryl phosphate synthase [Methanobacteriota archaeon]|nr:MAG: geranylgeranylglyceryl/heptaprenylglyceryl phosphate synthase [Euryarchaeota archaeon]
MSVFTYIMDRLREGPIHFTLIDPEKQDPAAAGEIAREAAEGGTDGLMLGGSVGVMQSDLDGTILAIKEQTSLPTILFPGDVSGISRHADAIFFMSLLNSRNPYFITGAQAAGAPLVKRMGVEVIPMGYLIVEPGGMAGYVGDARLVPRAKPEVAVAYGLAAQYLGMKLLYLEGGSGISEPIPPEMIGAVKSQVEIPVVVGGGIRSGKAAKAAADAGADIIITGTVVENTRDVKKKIKEIAGAVHR